MCGLGEQGSRRVMVRWMSYVMWLTAGCCWLAASTPLSAQTGAPPPMAQPVAEAVTAEAVADWIKQAEEAQDLDDATRTKIIAAYRQILDELKQTAELSAQAAEYAAATKSAEARLSQLREKIADLPQSPDVGNLESLSLAELEQEAAQQESRLKEMQQSLAVLEAEPTRRVERRKQIRTSLGAAPDKLADVAAQLKAPAPEGEPPLLTAARKRFLTVRREAIEQETETWQNELALLDAEDAVGLVRVRRDLLINQIKLAEGRLAKLQQAVNSRRQEDARQRLQEARRQAAEAAPALKSVAVRNREWAEQANQLSERIAQTSRELEAARGRLDDLERQFARAKQRVNIVGLTGAVGQLLRTERDSLPDVASLRARIEEREQISREVQFTYLRLDDERSELTDLDAAVAAAMADVDHRLSQERRDELQAAATELFAAQRDILDALIRNYGNHLDNLVSLDIVERQIIRETEAFTAFISERVLWIQSADSLGTGEVLPAGEGVRWLLSRGHWSQLLELLWNDALSRPLITVLAVLLFAAFAALLPYLRSQLRQAGSEAEKRTCQQLRPTLRAIGLTLCISIFWPVLLGYVGWRIVTLIEVSDFGTSIAAGLWTTALVCLPAQILRQACRTRGLGASHFNWPVSGLRICRRYLRVFLFAGLPLVFISATLEAQSHAALHLSLGRLSFILLQLLVAYCYHQVMRPDGGALNEFSALNKGGWVDRFRYVWYPLPLAIPLLLAVLAVFGYFYTARVLAARLFATICVVLLMIFVRSVLLRWVIVGRRRLRFAEVRQRVAEATGEAESAEGSGGVSLPVNVEADPGADLSVISEQTGRLLNTSVLAIVLTGIWFVWVGVLPALRILDRVELWPTTTAVASAADESAAAVLPSAAGAAANTEADNEAGTETSVIDTGIQTITLADLAKSVLLVVLAIFFARNFPGLLEIALLRHLPLDAAARFAITTVCSYVVILVGFIMAFMSIGIGWSKVQWLAAALTVGVGFGLQEIVANFVSGLIILIERPIRVGDVVTLDGVSGAVTRIRIRATTITNWDRQEFIVPNKDFITGRLLNWTLTDAVNRVVINVGIAYGSDTELARDLLVKTASDHPVILDEPPPSVTCEGFGDSALNFVLRVFLPRMDERLEVIHEMHTRIEQAFRAAGIEIAFPQRDIRMRTAVSPPLDPPSPNGAPQEEESGDNGDGPQTAPRETHEATPVSPPNQPGSGTGNDSYAP